jgi:Domain of unknown function (DUF4465)/Secretion system C-terminal sorting domain
VEGFENVTLDSGKVLNGINGDRAHVLPFNGLQLRLPVFWDTSYGGFWSSGWAISRKKDSSTEASSSSKHLYCAKPLHGDKNSNTFIVGQSGSHLAITRNTLFYISSFYITNTTYTYNSMKLGDFFGKKFGGKSGNDSDYLFVRVKFYRYNTLTDSQDVYLADFRNSDNSQDYLLKNWIKVSPKEFLYTDSVSFTMFSSDNGKYGMNTPGFFAIDNIEYDQIANVRETNEEVVKIFPNPATDEIRISMHHPIVSVAISTLNGQLVKEINSQDRMVSVDVQDLVSGFYVVKVKTNNAVSSSKILIQH